MSRNNLNSITYNYASANINRSKFKSLSHSLSTTFNEGDLYPILCLEVLPGDTFSIDTTSFVRMQTLMSPTFGDLYLDTYYFFVPNRLVWDHWVNFMGQNDTDYWTQKTEYTVPQLALPLTGYGKGTLGYCFIGPTAKNDYDDQSETTINALPFRAFTLIYNQWFRSENLQQPYVIHKDETLRTWSKPESDYGSLELGGTLPKVGKLHDLFTTALPEPQKGPAVEVPIGDIAPVKFGSDISNYLGTTPARGDVGMKVVLSNLTQSTLQPWTNVNNVLAMGYKGNGVTTEAMRVGPVNNSGGSGVNDNSIVIDNAYADLQSATAITINQLRLAFQTQKLFERDARAGSTYRELIYSHFNTICPDYTLQYSEYLGGSRSNINITPVVQSSESGTTPQGTITAISASGNVHSDFTKSFTEHGFIIGMCCVRVKHTYSQGIPKYLSRKTRLDYYFPVLAHIGEQPILKKELYATGEPDDNEVFGYHEAWYEYRHALDRVSGEFHPNYSQSLSSWIFTDYYTDHPSLSSSWFIENENNVDRVIAVQHTNADQFKANFYFNITAVRPMPVHSTPGFVDHF